jgi:hypothetical protein
VSITKPNKPRAQKAWLDKEVMLVKELSGTVSLSDITKKVNAVFGNKRTDTSIKARCHKHGFPLRLIGGGND